MIVYDTIKIVCAFLWFLRSTQSAGANRTDAENDHDATVLLSALYPTSTPNQEIIAHLLVRRTNDERQEIKKAFKRRYKEDLVLKLELELSNDFQDIVVAMMTPQNKFYARELHNAIAGWGTDEEAIAEILGPMNNVEFQQVTAVYKKVYGRALKDDLIGDTSGFFQDLLIAMCNGQREGYYGKIDQEAAFLEAGELVQKIHMADNMEEALIRILTTRSIPQLKATFEEYEKISKADIRAHLKRRVYNEFYYGIMAIVQSVFSKSDYFAGQLEESMLGIGTNDRQLIRIVVGRSEIDLPEIRKSYERIYGVSLVDRITDDTSGLYSYLLCALVKQ